MDTIVSQSTGLIKMGRLDAYAAAARMRSDCGRAHKAKRAVMGARRLALDRRCGLRRWFGFLRHHQRAELGVGCENAMGAAGRLWTTGSRLRPVRLLRMCSRLKRESSP